MGSSSGPSKKIFLRDATGLLKEISTFQALSAALWGIGIMYVFSAVIYGPSAYPSANPLVIPVSGFLLSLPVAAVYVMMTIAMPRSGGDYVWVSRVTHPSIGFMTNFALTLTFLAFPGAGAALLSEWGLSEWAYDLGKIYGNNQAYLNLAGYLQTQTPVFWLGVIELAIAGSIAIVSTKLAVRIMVVSSIISIIIIAIFVGVAFSAGQSTFASNFNSLSGANYDQVVTAGQNAGSYNGVPAFLSAASLLAGAASLTGYTGFNFPAYFSGEVRYNKRSQIVSQIGSTIIFFIIFLVVTLAWYFGEGPSFANAMSVLWASGSSQYPYINAPVVSGMSMFWAPNAVLVSIFNFGFVFGIVITVVGQIFALSRNLFAWSFDRVMPATLASVNDRTHSPVHATIVMVLIAIVFEYFTVYQATILSVFFSYSIAGLFIVYLIVSVIAVIYPFKRKDIFDNTDPLARRKIGGFPLISLLGILSIIACLITIYGIAVPVISGFIPIFFEGILPTFVIGFVIYWLAWAIRRRQGINLALIQGELPPE
ncbi:MAG: APC family permease [Candidatus Bathyarchaeia archaeon]